jgi:hypothetical protein
MRKEIEIVQIYAQMREERPYRSHHERRMRETHVQVTIPTGPVSGKRNMRVRGEELPVQARKIDDQAHPVAWERDEGDDGSC